MSTTSYYSSYLYAGFYGLSNAIILLNKKNLDTNIIHPRILIFFIPIKITF